MRRAMLLCATWVTLFFGVVQPVSACHIEHPVARGVWVGPDGPVAVGMYAPYLCEGSDNHVRISRLSGGVLDAFYGTVDIIAPEGARCAVEGCDFVVPPGVVFTLEHPPLGVRLHATGQGAVHHASGWQLVGEYRDAPASFVAQTPA